MRVSRTALLALSSFTLSAFASPVAQLLPPFEGITLPPVEPTITTSEEPVFTIQTSMPSDTAYPAPTTICSEGQDPGYPMTCEPDGTVTIQTSTPVTDSTAYYMPTSEPPHCTTRSTAYPIPTENPTASALDVHAQLKEDIRHGAGPVLKVRQDDESTTDGGDDYDDEDDADDVDDADDADDTDDTGDSDEYGEAPWCDEEITSSTQSGASSTDSYIAPTSTSSSASVVATPTSTGKISRIYPVRALISRCLEVDDDEPTDGSRVIISACDDGPKQDWELVPAQWYSPGDNVYIKLAGTNYCLDASFPVGSGTPMKIWTCYDGLVQQRWNYNINGSLVLVDQGQCLDLTDGEIDSGTIVQTWECFKGNSNQRWFVIDKPE